MQCTMLAEVYYVAFLYLVKVRHHFGGCASFYKCIMLYSYVMSYIALLSIWMQCIVSYCYMVLGSTALYHIWMHYIALHCIALNCCPFECTALHNTALQFSYILFSVRFQTKSSLVWREKTSIFLQTIPNKNKFSLEKKWNFRRQKISNKFNFHVEFSYLSSKRCRFSSAYLYGLTESRFASSKHMSKDGCKFTLVSLWVFECVLILSVREDA